MRLIYNGTDLGEVVSAEVLEATSVMDDLTGEPRHFYRRVRLETVLTPDDPGPEK